jgi:hypothetical protein
MTINTTVTNVSCYGGNSGAITITSVTGGTGTKTYAWSDGPTTQNRTNLTAANNYVVTVTDANGCTQSSTAISVTQPSAALGGSTVTSAPSCTGGATGGVTLTVSGGSPFDPGGTPYFTYAWSNGAITKNLSNVSSGTYTVTITDFKGCTAITSGTVTDPAPVALTGTITNVNCNGGSTGSVDVSASGGTSPYTYKILIGGTYGSGHLFGTLAAGTYAIYAKDANGCEKTLDFTVTQPSAALSATPTVTNVSCNGGSTGAISLAVTGGTSPYAFAWTASPGTVPSGQSTNQNLTGLIKGTYSVTITDAKGCTFSLSSGTAVSVTEPTVLSLSNTTTNVSCNGGSNGTVDLSVSGGTTAYTYAWSNGITTQDLASLAAGTYSVTVTDAKGCTATNSATITQPTVLSGSATPTAAACYGGSTGSINLTVTTGTSPYTFAWTGPSSYTSTAEDPSGLAAGTYNVTITDYKGCTAPVSAIVSQPASFSLSTTVVQPTCPPTTDGSISLTVSGGTSGYTYSWTGSSGGTVPSGQAALNNPSGLNPGTYSVTVTDSRSCTTSTSVTLSYQHPNPSVPGTITKN